MILTEKHLNIPKECIYLIYDFLGPPKEMINNKKLCNIFIKYGNRNSLNPFSNCLTESCNNKCYTNYCKKCTIDYLLN